MSRIDLKINGKNAREHWGIVTTPQSLSALLAPAPMKEGAVFSSRLENGARRDNSNPRINERSLNLELQMIADNPEQFYDRYDLFCEELEIGALDICLSDRPDVVYHTLYESCSAYTQFIREYAILSLKLVEPNPTIRS